MQELEEKEGTMCGPGVCLPIKVRQRDRVMCRSCRQNMSRLIKSVMKINEIQYYFGLPSYSAWAEISKIALIITSKYLQLSVFLKPQLTESKTADVASCTSTINILWVLTDKVSWQSPRELMCKLYQLLLILCCSMIIKFILDFISIAHKHSYLLCSIWLVYYFFVLFWIWTFSLSEDVG